MPSTPTEPQEAATAFIHATLFRQLAVQVTAALLVLSLAWPYFVIRNEMLPWPETALAIGAIAWALAQMTHQPPWWNLIHAGFAPLAWAVSLLNIDPGWFLLIFMILLLFFRGAVSGKIPLYLTNSATITTLKQLLATSERSHFVDLGAGIGNTLAPLCKDLPTVQFTGIENAPASWLIGWLRTRRLTNATWRMGDLWQLSLKEYDVVYAFLSPAPMPALWQKIQREMAPNSLFISNTFAVPGVVADEVLELNDRRRTRLYCYRLHTTSDCEIRAESPVD